MGAIHVETAAFPNVHTSSNVKFSVAEDINTSRPQNRQRRFRLFLFFYSRKLVSGTSHAVAEKMIHQNSLKPVNLPTAAF